MATFTNQSKNTALYSNQSKNTNAWDMIGTDTLLLETGYKLLLETGFGIILEQSSSITSTFTNQTKN